MTIGHVHLRSTDIDRVREFYVGVLGFEVVAEARAVPGWGTTGDVLFVSAGGHHHHLGFNTWKSRDGGPQPVEASPRDSLGHLQGRLGDLDLDALAREGA